MNKVSLFFSAGLLFFTLTSGKAQALKADDRFAITNMVYQWNQLQDDGNVTDFMQLWAKDASFTNPFGTFTGKPAIQKFVEGYVSGFAKGKRHQCSNLTITANGSQVLAIEDLTMVEVTEIPYIVATVRNNMTFVKESGSWKLKEVKGAIDPGFNKLMEKMKAGK